MTKKVVAIAYDFDGTLAPGNMQQHSFIPKLEMSAEKFWEKTKNLAKANDMDEILAYMQLMLHEATYRGISIRKQAFVDHGRGLKLFDGVGYWFDRINDYARRHDVVMEHYIISSGLREMIEGTLIYSKFKYVFASGFMYNQDDIAIWPALAVNYTNKTQYLFRINKGIHNSWDNPSVNKFIPEENRPVPFKNMIYLGDGETDIPAMKMTRHNGGKAIAVYDPSSQKAKAAADQLIEQQRADYSYPADYTEGSELDKKIKELINER